MSKPKEPLRMVVSLEGIERVEIWGIDRADRDVAEQLYYGLTNPIGTLGDSCKGLSKRSSRS